MNLRRMTSGKIFVNGYNEILMNVHLLEYNESQGPQYLSNDASFVIFCIGHWIPTYQNHWALYLERW